MPTAIVTGSNRGIGLAIVTQLAKDGYSVFAACRKGSPELSAVQGITVVEGVECTKTEGVEKLKSAIGSTAIDLLVHNAGKGDPDTGLDHADLANMMREMFEVNAIGPVLVTNGVKANLAKGSHVAVVTSTVGSMDMMSQLPMKGLISYPTSKAAANMMALRMAPELKEAGISIALYHPGVVATDMLASFLGGPQKAGNASAFGEVISTETSAAGMIAQWKTHKVEDGCTYKDFKGDTLKW